MTLYLDASVLVALFTNDPLTVRADAFLRHELPILIVSDFAAAEFASAIARRVRIRDITSKTARSAFSTFDTWTERVAQHIALSSADVTMATAFLRRLDLNLRTPDALNIAMAHRAGASLATFDDKMAACAKALRTPVAAI